MKLEDIIKAVEEKELGADIISAIKALDTSEEVTRLSKELEAEQGKSSGILDDKKKYKERAENAESKLKEIEKAKLPEDERHKQEMQELKDKLEAEKVERENQAQEFAKTQREAQLADLTSSVKWADGTPHPTAKLIISNAMADVDLSDQDKVNEALNAVKESHKSFIAAEAPGGSGAKGGSSSGGGGNDGASSIADNQNAIWGSK